MKKIGFLVGVLILTIFILATNLLTVAEASNDSSSTMTHQDNQISESDAKNALQNFIEIRNFQHGEVILTEKLYDVDDSLLAYFFTIEDTKGYYIVAAVDTLNPIMEYGVYATYPVSFDQKGEKKAYYLGINNILFAYNAEEIQSKFITDNKRDLKTSILEEEELKELENEKIEEKKSLENKRESLRNSLTIIDPIIEDNIINLEIEINQIDIRIEEHENLQMELQNNTLEPFAKQSKRSSLWDELLTPADSTMNSPSLAASSITSAYFSVPRWWQRMPGVVEPGSACGPTSAAMVINYYHDIRGFTSMRDDSYYGSQATTINHMRNDMKSNLWGVLGATLNDWANGVTTHIKETATSNWYAVQVVNPSSSSYSNSLKYRSAIESKHPVAIRFKLKVANTDGLKYHFVVGNGWYLTGSNYDNLMIEFEDPDGNARAIDWSNYVQDFDFAYMQY